MKWVDCSLSLRTLLRSESQQAEQTESNGSKQTAERSMNSKALDANESMKTGSGSKAKSSVSMIDRLDGDWKCGSVCVFGIGLMDSATLPTSQHRIFAGSVNTIVENKNLLQINK